MSFSGFSEDDIRKLTKGNESNKTQKGSHKSALKKVTFKPSNNINNAQRPKSSFNNNSNTNNTPAHPLPENAKLSVPDKPVISSNVLKKAPKQNPEEKLDQDNKEEAKQENETGKEDKKYKNLDEFEARQKLIEEQNRKRKELLSQALADRTKRTQEEAQRLTEIQEEFKKLDAVLCGDVKILRKQIELASIDYMECEKRYNKIEKEFLDAKVLLHQKQEKKELLTEHLCAIIEKNEERKAEKLNELLQRLQLSPPINGFPDGSQDVNVESVVETK